jgi:hypothetical protein
MSRSRLAVSFGPQLDLDIFAGESAPTAAEGLLVPQDVHLIMGEVETLEVSETPGSVAEILTCPARPHALGSLVLAPGRKGVPLLLQAVVYDFDRSPHVREGDVFHALVAAFEEMKSRGLTCLAVQPLGTAHAGVSPECFLALLLQVCYSSAELGTSLRRVHLLLPNTEDLERYEVLLREVFGAPGSRV